MLERGSVSFFVQPRVDTPEITSLRDVQRTHMLLTPEGGTPSRRVMLGHKRLPRTGQRERFWSLIDRIGPLPWVLGDLGPSHYRTKTQGDRFQPGTKWIALGRYAIAHHEDHTHLEFELDWEDPDRRLRDAIALRSEGHFLLLSMRPAEVLPERLARHFGDARFAEPLPELLDQEGMSLVLIPIEHTISMDLGEPLPAPV